nr:reverse transcriptase domain-containing protein [Tanacetum cinerariifolium]
MAEKFNHEKEKNEKLKELKARLNSGTSRIRRERSKSPIKRERSRSPWQRTKEGGVFKRLGSRGKSVFARSDSYNHQSHSRYTEALSESEDSGRRHWKSRSKKKRSSGEEDDLSQPWVCEEIDSFTPRIRYFYFPKTRMPSHIKTYDGSGDPKDHLKIFQAAAKTEWAMPTWCHMFNSTLTGNARVWFDDLPPESIDSYDDLKKEFLEKNSPTKESFSPNPEISFPPLEENEGAKGPMIIEAEIGGYCVHHMYVDGGSASEIITFCLGLDEFMVVRSQSPSNGIIGRHIVRKLQAVPSTAHGMLKIPVEGGVITLKSSKLVLLECAMVSGPAETPSATKPIAKERVKVAINPEYPKQTVMIGSTLTEGGRNKLCGLLQRNLDIFSWKPADMTDVPRHIAKHRLTMREGCSPIRQKKRGQAADKPTETRKYKKKLENLWMQR